MKRLLAATLAFFSLSTLAHAVLGRDDQWTYVPATADHGARAELRGDWPEGVPSLLIFQIECDRESPTLTFRYDPDLREFEQPYPENEAFELVIDDDARTFVMPRRRGDGPFERRLLLNDEIVVAVQNARDFLIYAPNESGHPWIAGRAPAFRRLVSECGGARR